MDMAVLPGDEGVHAALADAASTAPIRSPNSRLHAVIRHRHTLTRLTAVTDTPAAHREAAFVGATTGPHNLIAIVVAVYIIPAARKSRS